MNEKFTMIELFSGIGAQERALRQLNIPYEITHTCDCDKDAVLSYAAMRFNLEEEIKTFDFPSKEQMVKELQVRNVGFDFEKGKHTITERTNEEKVKQYYIADYLTKNLGDISKVKKLPYADLITYSSPCQSFSVAGKLAGAKKICKICGHEWEIDFSNPDYNYNCPHCGNADLSSTTSGLLQEVQRLLSVAYENNELPKYLLLENVKNLTGNKFIGQFTAWIKWLDSIGYNTYWKILNAKKFSIPQNRERVFALSIRKDIDNGFTFPKEISLTTRLKDVLEKNVSEKYYLSDEVIEKYKDKISIPLKRGYSVDVTSNEPDSTEIDPIGNYSKSDYNVTPIVNKNGVAPTVRENHGQVTAILEKSMTPIEKDKPQIIKVDIPQTVTVRTYEVDTDKLSATLKEAKKNISLTNKDIAEQLNQPLTLVEHWFRSDDCFSIPNPVVWYKLKSLLKITTDEFDTSIMTFEERPGVFEKSNRCYHQDGIAPTLTCIEGEKVIVDNEPFIVASRGRSPENPSDRTTGAPTEQRLEPNFSGCTNTLTSVQKDNYVVEPMVCEERKDEGLRFFKDDCIGTLRTIDACGDKRVLEPEVYQIANVMPGTNRDNPNQGRVYDVEGLAPTLTKMDGGNRQPMVVDDIKWRIRKLTPKECWRLMGFTDKDNERASQYISPSALYKQAGNSICTCCLIAIFSSLLLENGDKADVWSQYLINYCD